MNRNYIAAALCEKKTEPQNLCQGKCQLKKQLEKDSERQEKNTQNIKNSPEILFSQVQDRIGFMTFPTGITTTASGFNSSVFSGHPAGVFHPPSC